MYRIISGRWKSKRISAPKNFDVRPTTDFAKEALFSIIENRFDFDEEFISVLDLFAGIGGLRLGFEQAFNEAGFETECVLTSEIKSHAVRALKENFNKEHVKGDICKIKSSSFPDFDFLLDVNQI